MASIFTKIINGEIPAYKIAENDDYIAFLDAFPIAKGHTLVVPKQETDRIWDLSPEQFNGLMACLQSGSCYREKHRLQSCGRFCHGARSATRTCASRANE